VRVVARNDVRVSGGPSGQPIMFAHGYGCDQAMWRYVTPAFASEFKIVTFDHVGFGGSDPSAWTPARYSTLQAYADDVNEIIDALGLNEVIFVGHSVAAMIGVLAAITRPEQFAHLVLVGPSPRYIDEPDTGYVGGFSSADIDDLLETLDSNHLGWSASMAPIVMGNPDRPELAQELAASFCRTDPRVASSFARATFLADNRADLPKVPVPCLVLQCDQDAIAGDQVGRYVDEHLPRSTFVRLEATGHCPNLSAPEETSAAIRTYLQEHGCRTE
jgi:sigma-B regulation protein RsbQ